MILVCFSLADRFLCSLFILKVVLGFQICIVTWKIFALLFTVYLVLKKVFHFLTSLLWLNQLSPFKLKIWGLLWPWLLWCYCVLCQKSGFPSTAAAAASSCGLRLLPLYLIYQSRSYRKNLFSLLIQLGTNIEEKGITFLIRSTIYAIPRCATLVSDQESKTPSVETSVWIFSAWYPNFDFR